MSDYKSDYIYDFMSDYMSDFRFNYMSDYMPDSIICSIYNLSNKEGGIALFKKCSIKKLRLSHSLLICR